MYDIRGMYRYCCEAHANAHEVLTYRRSLLFVSLLSCKTYKLSYVREQGNKVDCNEVFH